MDAPLDRLLDGWLARRQTPSTRIAIAVTLSV
eukprot:COSAG01_NODE_5586_length_4163_cov_1.538878_1_plen_31_part_10